MIDILGSRGPTGARRESFRANHSNGRPSGRSPVLAALRRSRPIVPGQVVSDAPASTVFIAKLVMIALGIAMTIALVAAAPQTVLVPLTIALLAGLAVTGVVAGATRTSRPPQSPTPGPPRPSRLGAARRHPKVDGGLASAEREMDGASPERGGAGLAAVSIGSLALALLVQGELGVALGAVGLAGLVVLRLVMSPRRWIQPCSLGDPARMPVQEGESLAGKLSSDSSSTLSHGG